MGSITAGGHNFRQLRVDGGRLKAELTRISERNPATRFFLRKGSVITEISLEALEPSGSDIAGEPYVLIVEEQVS